LADNDEAERIYAAEDIGWANSADGVEPLVAHLPKERSRAVREAIFAALGRIDDDAVIAGVLPLLRSEDSFARNEAVELLRARGARAVPFLAEAFERGDRDERKFIVDALARIDSPAARPVFDRALCDPDVNVVIAAVEAAGSARRVEHRARLEALIGPSAHPMLAGAVLEALAEMGDCGSLDAVRAAFGGSEGIPGHLRASYLKLLGAAGSAGDCGELSLLMSLPYLETHAMNALTALRNRHGKLDLPAEAVMALKRIAGECRSALPGYQAVRLLAVAASQEGVLRFLGDALEHPEKGIRIGAIEALSESGSPEAGRLFQERLPREPDSEVAQLLEHPPGEPRRGAAGRAPEPETPHPTRRA
jgi:HEAT repeat protein